MADEKHRGVEEVGAGARRPYLSIGGVVGVTLSSLALGCSVPQRGELTARSEGTSGTVEVDEPVLLEGPLRAELPSGDRCNGTFTQVNVADLEGLGAPPLPIRNSDAATVATLNCGRGGTLRCTLSRKEGGVFGFGECKDAEGNEYKLRF